MAEFTADITVDGKTIKIPARTCEPCNGIGYLTEPYTYQSRRAGEMTWQIHRAESGDRCPTCNGRGWVGVIGKAG